MKSSLSDHSMPERCTGEKAWVIGDVVEGAKKSRMAEEVTVVPVD